MTLLQRKTAASFTLTQQVTHHMLRTLLATALALLLSVAQADDLPLPGDSAPARTVSSSSKPHAKPAHRAPRPSASRHHGKRSVNAKHRRSSRSAKAALHRQGKTMRHHGKVTSRHAGKTVKASRRHQAGQHAAKLSAHARKKSASKKPVARHASKTQRAQLTKPLKRQASMARHNRAARAHHVANAAKSRQKSMRHPAARSSKVKPGKGASSRASARQQHKQRQHQRRR